MNLAYHFPIMFWNCACLISDAGGNDNEEEDDEEAIEELKHEESYSNEMEEFNDETDEEEDSYEEEDCDGYPAEVIKTTEGRKKKKVKATNYGKIATAIGRIKMTGVEVAPPDINQSTFTFSPDIENNTIRYGLSGITRIGNDLVNEIIGGRPYKNIDDFLNKIKVNKTQMINLIKSGAFDSFGKRVDLMKNYVGDISGAKKRITLQNMKMLIDFKLLPPELEFEQKVFNFNKYLKKMKLDDYYGLDNIAFGFYESNFDIDLLTPSDTESGFMIKQTKWDAIYQKYMDRVRPYVQKHNKELLEAVNNKLMSDTWDKYCKGSISHWEMESISCYLHSHELENVNFHEHGFSEFYDISENPEIEKYIPIKGKMIPIFKLHRIVGTVLDRDKSKKTVTLLTREGVVTVKIYGGIFAQYDKQLSEKDATGHKHIIEKSMFSRGNIIIVCGVRDGETEFRAKKYSKTPYHTVEQIINIEGDRITTHSRSTEAQ